MINNYNYQTSIYECDECITRGVCAVNSTASSFQEIILLYLKELAFYISRLKNFGITNTQIKESFIFSIFNIVTNTEFNQEQFSDLIKNLYNYINQSKLLYEKSCIENNIKQERPKSYFKYSKSFNLTDAIRKGEKYFLKKSLNFSQKQKDYYDIVIFLVKGFCIKCLELKNLGKDYDNGYYEMLSLLNIISLSEFSEDLVKKEINNSIHVYYDLVKDVFYTQVELYGEPGETEVSFSIQQGHAILISGSDYKKLENVLKSVEGTEIGVYTHGIEMLMAHAFPKINSHPNLKGHYGTSIDSSLLDFASFPGAILMTKGSLLRVEYLYRGRLFTLDPIAPTGIVQIKNNDFTPLIKSASEAKGFVANQKKPPLSVGVNEKEFNSAIDNIVDKILSKKIKNLYIVGLLNTPNIAYKEYFESFFKLIGKDDYVISLSFPYKAENVLHFSSFSDYSLYYKILRKLKDKINFEETNITVFVTRCDKHSIANLIYLNEINVKNIFLCKCLPTLINPGILNTLQDAFNVNMMTNVNEDWNKINKDV